MKTINNILIYGAVAALSLLGSCTKGIEEQGGGELAPGTVQVQLTLPNAQPMKTRATDVTAAENFIGNVQMLFWETGENSIGRYLSIDPKKPVVDVGTVWNPATGTLTIRNSGFYDCVIYVMVNGKGDEFSKAFKNQAEILDVIAEHSGAIIDPATHPLPMSGISPMVTFNPENTTQVTVNLHRMVAKVNVTVNLDADFLKAYPDCVFGKAAGQEAALKLVNIPSKSYVFQKTPIVIPTNALDANNISDMPVKENGTGKDMTWTTTAYVFENPTADPATSMKIGLYLPYKDGTNPAATSNYYQLLEVNHTATADRVKRNWIYNMTVTVNGFGKENVTVNTIVEPWNVENIETDVEGTYVRIQSIKAGTTDLETNPDYKFNRNGETVTVALAANVVGTKVELLNADGSVADTEMHLDIAIKNLTLAIPINFGVEGGAAVAARNYTLRITNPTTKIYYTSTTPVDKIEITRSQGAIVWANKNVGAIHLEHGGNTFQYDRNNAFAPVEDGDIPASSVIIGPVVMSVAEANAAKWINTNSSSLSWCKEATKEMWLNDPANSPCGKIYGTDWRVPNMDDFRKLPKVVKSEKPIAGPEHSYNVVGFYLGADNANKVFFPLIGMRSDNGAVAYASFTTVDATQMRSTFWTCENINLNMAYCPAIYENGNVLMETKTLRKASGSNLRCVKYID